MSRPRLLIVPQLTELEWPTVPELEKWAEVATYDAPGVGEEPPAEEFGPAAVAERGLEELDRRGWDSCVVVADEYAGMAAMRLMTARPEAVEAFALGHACLSNRVEGDRPPLYPGVQAALAQTFHASFAACIQALAQATQHAYDDQFVERYLARVPRDLYAFFFGSATPPSEPVEERLKKLDLPLLFAKHEGCLLHTPEGFEDALATFPEAQVTSVTDKPSASSEFAEALCEFCTEVEGGE